MGSVSFWTYRDDKWVYFADHYEVDLAQIQKNCEEWIRAGKASRARKVLSSLDFSKIPRSQLHVFCSLARRSQIWSLSLKALKDLIHPKTKLSAKATPVEKIEYALALRRAGAFAEADRLLLEPDLANEPRATLAKAFGSIYRWDYLGALELLDEYIRAEGPSEYEVLVAKVNRLACLNFLGDSRFESKFEELKKALSGGRNLLLFANCLEMSGQYLLEQSRWSESRSALGEAESLLAEEGGRSLLNVKKWQRILKAMESRSTKDIRSFYADALAAREWESLRNLDYFMTRLEPDGPWAYRVYFGTPYASFRSRLEKIRDFPETYQIGDSEKKPVFDPWFPGQEEGSLSHRMMVYFLRDFYRPVSMGEIFSVLHEDEYFDVRTSVTRVRKMLERTQEYIAKVQCPIVLEAEKASYLAKHTGAARLEVRKANLDLKRDHFLFQRYRFVENPPTFASEWANALGVSAGNVSRLLKSGVDKDVLHRVGQGRYTKYILV